MTMLHTLTFAAAMLLANPSAMTHSLRQGFSLPDSVEEFTMVYRTMDNLILLPFQVNDSLSVNLVLDTSCRTILLFGRHFEEALATVPEATVQFSGMGTGKPVEGKVSLGNLMRMGPITGENIPIVVATQKKPFKNHMKIDGLIGYDIFTRFEVEVHPYRQEITFRSAFNKTLPPGYKHIPLNMSAQKPMICSTIHFPDETIAPDMLVDTGSTLGLLVKSSQRFRFDDSTGASILGRGLNGLIKGSTTFVHRLLLHNFEIGGIPAGVTYTPQHDYASVGMAVLKNYDMVINCVQSYMGLRLDVPVIEDALL